MPHRKNATLRVRCDATSATGLGHFARCRDLARLLTAQNPNLKVEFLGALSPYAQGELLNLGFTHIALHPDEPVVCEELVRPGSAYLLDSYRLTADELYSPLLSGLAVGVFDDFGVAEKAPVALVLNARITAPERFSYESRAQGLGTGFLGVCPELLELRKRHEALEPRPEIAQVGVFIGATDHFGAGETIVRTALEVFPEARIAWVGGKAIDERVREIALGPNIANVLEMADLAIAGGGRLKYEAGYALMPLASVSQTSLQDEDTRELCERGLCVDLGMATSLSVAQLRERLEALRESGVRERLRLAQSRAFPANAPERLVNLVESALGLLRTELPLRDRDSR